MGSLAGMRDTSAKRGACTHPLKLDCKDSYMYLSYWIHLSVCRGMIVCGFNLVACLQQVTGFQALYLLTKDSILSLHLRSFIESFVH